MYQSHATFVVSQILSYWYVSAKKKLQVHEKLHTKFQSLTHLNCTCNEMHIWITTHTKFVSFLGPVLLHFKKSNEILEIWVFPHPFLCHSFEGIRVFHFRAETELTVQTTCMSKNCKFLLLLKDDNQISQF